MTESMRGEERESVENKKTLKKEGIQGKTERVRKKYYINLKDIFDATK